MLLERWLDSECEGASDEERARFEGLLDLQDPELARYLLAGEPHPDPGLAELIARIRRH